MSLFGLSTLTIFFDTMEGVLIDTLQNTERNLSRRVEAVRAVKRNKSIVKFITVKYINQAFFRMY